MDNKLHIELPTKKVSELIENNIELIKKLKEADLNGKINKIQTIDANEIIKLNIK